MRFMLAFLAVLLFSTTAFAEATQYKNDVRLYFGKNWDVFQTYRKATTDWCLTISDSDGAGLDVDVMCVTNGSNDLDFAGQMVLEAGVGALQFEGSAASVTFDDNDSTALVFGSVGRLDLLILNSGDGTESVIVRGTNAVTALHVDIGTSLFDELVTYGAGAGTHTFTNTAASGVFNDNDPTAFLWGASGTLNVMTLDTTDSLEGLTVNGYVSSPTVATHAKELRFCGNGPDGATPQFLGPILEADFGTDMTFGEAGCDAKDNATEGTADEVWHPQFAYKVVSMACVAICTGATAANDAVVFQLRDDTADVTGMTCTTAALGGDATPAQCTIQDGTPVTIAAGSALAVDVTMVDDDCNDAGDDFECVALVTY